MAVRVSNFACCLCLFALIIQFPGSTSAISSPDVKRHPKAISDLEEVITRGLGLQSDDLKISGFDLRDVLVGQSLSYEFDLEIDDKVLPIKLLDDVNRWKYADLPIFQVKDQATKAGNETGLVAKKKKRKKGSQALPVLAPFQLAGPMELWVQDAKNIKLSLPHPVDAGELRKVVIADGAVVTVKGAKSVSLLQPIELGLPLNRTQNGFASAILTLARYLQHRARTHNQPLSLCIVGPTSLTSPKSSLKRLAPGLFELSSPKPNPKHALSTIGHDGQAPTLLGPNQFTTVWPFVAINGSSPDLVGLDTLLWSVLGSKASKEGSFRLLKADVSAQTFVKIGFNVEKNMTANGSNLYNYYNFPKWRTKPEIIRMHFEVLAKIDGDKIVPERVVRVNPVLVKDTVAMNVITGNVTNSNTRVINPPPNPFTL